jgi:hypothetical protein
MDHAAIASMRKQMAVFSAIVLGIDVLGLGGIAVHIVTSLETFEGLFADMGAPLPGLTRLVLSVGTVGWCVILGTAAMGLVVKEALIRQPGIRLGINVVAALIAVIFFLVYRHVLTAPMYGMLEPLQR